MLSVESCKDELKNKLKTESNKIDEERQSISTDPLDILSDECIDKFVQPITQMVTQVGIFIGADAKTSEGRRKILKHSRDVFKFQNLSKKKSNRKIDQTCKELLASILDDFDLKDMQIGFDLCKRIGYEFEVKLLPKVDI